MHWIVLAVLGLILTIVGIFSLRLYREEKKRWQKLGDKDVLRGVLAFWEPVVLDNEKTMRSVKRFSNRARFMTNDELDPLIPRLVGLIALDEIGLMDHPLSPIYSAYDLDKWKQRVSEKLATSVSQVRLVAVKEWLDSLTQVDWNRYRDLATQGRSRSGDYAGRLTSSKNE